jgi:molecular chaperone GrpE
MGEENNFQYVLLSVFPREGKRLCLRRTTSDSHVYELISGPIRKSENIRQALARILKEETGMVADEFIPIGLAEIQQPGKKAPDAPVPLIAAYWAEAGISGDFKLKEKNEYRWLELDEWLGKGKDRLTPQTHEILEKLKIDLQKDDYENAYKRALADYQNLLKQSAAEKRDLIRFSNETLLQDILPVYENLKLALKHAGQKTEKDSLAEGLGYVLKQFKSVLQDAGVEEIYTEGQVFDHNTMDAANKVITEDKEKDGMVAEELKSGYKLNGKVIEHAKVTVWEFERAIGKDQ